MVKWNIKERIMTLKVLELFAGQRSIGKAFEKRGHEVFSIEWDKQHENINWYTDIGSINTQDILDRFGYPDVIWASPDCSSYSIAAISHHRTKEEDGNLAPKSELSKSFIILRKFSFTSSQNFAYSLLGAKLPSSSLVLWCDIAAILYEEQSGEAHITSG